MKYILFCLCTLLSFSLTAQQGEALSIPLADPAQPLELTVDIKSGNITVLGSNRQDVQVRYVNRDAGPLRMVDADNGLKKITGGAPNLEISAQQNRVKLHAQNWNNTLDLQIEIPRKANLHLSTYNHGKINIESVEGEITTNNFNGPITAGNISGSLIADSYNGAIDVSFTRIQPGTPMAFSTYNGDITLTLPASTQATFKMKADQDIYSAFDIALKTDQKAEAEKSKDGFRRILGGWIIGELNGGGPEYRIETHNGEIYIRKN